MAYNSSLEGRASNSSKNTAAELVHWSQTLGYGRAGSDLRGPLASTEALALCKHQLIPIWKFLSERIVPKSQLDEQPCDTSLKSVNFRDSQQHDDAQKSISPSLRFNKDDHLRELNTLKAQTSNIAASVRSLRQNIHSLSRKYHAKCADRNDYSAYLEKLESLLHLIRNSKTLTDGFGSKNSSRTPVLQPATSGPLSLMDRHNGPSMNFDSLDPAHSLGTMHDSVSAKLPKPPLSSQSHMSFDRKGFSTCVRRNWSKSYDAALRSMIEEHILISRACQGNLVIAATAQTDLSSLVR
ncbi:hypothetical protein DFS34DRAFT_636938 [Phlyctochytrium arcticum]|nr:hypothetical protein DFS34DRAFT_636938 [Phlyctochytrium arcticum]